MLVIRGTYVKLVTIFTAPRCYQDNRNLSLQVFYPKFVDFDGH